MDRPNRTHRTASRQRRRGRRAARARQRGVSGILAMMFLVIFGSLAVAMAVVSQGNLRTAETHQRVTRAQGAVDTGLDIARNRLAEAASRFVVAKGTIDPDYAGKLWDGTYSSTPAVAVLPPPDGRVENSPSTSLAECLEAQHASDAAADLISPIALGDPPNGWVRANPIALELDPQGKAVTAAQVDYAPPDARGRVLVVSTGYEWDWLRRRWITRTAQQYFSISKTLKHSIIAPSRIMLGRNVAVNGPLGVRYDSAALDTLDGPPLVSKSDFQGLNSGLDAKLAAFRAAVLADDVDGDNRLRLGHPIESRSLGTLNAKDFDGNGSADGAYADMTRDNAIDEYDIFLRHYDTNHDGKVVLASSLTDGTPAEGQATEFSADNALAALIDGSKPDRNGNGRRNGDMVNGDWVWSTFQDNNRDGQIDSGDVDEDDVALGYRDGVLDYRDQYAKIRGSVYFKARRQAWEDSHDEFNVRRADYQKDVAGTIKANKNEAPVKFEATDTELPEITEDSFAAAADEMGAFSTQSGVSSASFATQVADAKGGGWTPTTRIESTPYGSPSPADWLARPVYDNITFRNVVIPMGTNALFINCTFVGVTRVECYKDNSHPSWNFYGEQVRNAATGQLSLRYPPPPAESDAQLDKSYSTPGAPNYNSLPDPLTVLVDLNHDGTANDACTNTKLVANNIRFHDCLFIGSIVADKPRVYSHIRNKLSFTGATKFADEHPTSPNDPKYALTEQEKSVTTHSSMMLPHYSVDIGTNNSPTTQDVRLHGAVIAGVLDVRGNAEVDGALLLTFKPQYGAAPLSLYGTPVGNPQGFNVTLGYFGPADGDQEGIDLSTMADLDSNGVPDVGWDSARDPTTGALIPVGTSPVQESWFDGVPDTDANPATSIRRAIPFNGFGKITLNLDPNLVLPDGLSAPLSVAPVANSYQEGRFAGAQ